MTQWQLAGPRRYIGAREPRLEDDRLLTGKGAFVADMRFPDVVDMALVRSPVPHALIRGVSIEAARGHSGVLAAVTAADLSDVECFPDFFTEDVARPVRAFPLARDKVKFVGQAVAAVVATNRYAAEDAAELVDLDLVDLPTVNSYDAATALDAPRIYDDWADNFMVDARYHDTDVDQILASNRVFSGRYTVQRHSPLPMETRGCVGVFEGGKLTLYSGNQSPHIARTILSMMLPITERHIRVVVPDIGGGFGAKSHIYPEEILVCWLAMRLGRPVRWIEDRAEHMVATGHSRQETIDLEVAVAGDGVIQAVRAHVQQDLGSGEIFPGGFAPSFVTAGALCGPYRIPHAELSVTCAVTNKTPSGAYRGYGAPEGVFALERLIDEIARELGQDRIELRRRMLLTADDLPFVTAAGARLDSGSFVAAFDRAVELTEAAAVQARADASETPHVRIGVGYSTYLEGSAPTYYPVTGNWAAHESASIRVDGDGGVTVYAGGAAMGQGLVTMVASLTADALGVDRDNVHVDLGDTDTAPYGLGAWGSRSSIALGGAVLKAAAEIRHKVLAIAAHRLEVDQQDLVVESGTIHPIGSPQPHAEFADIANSASVRTFDLPPGIDPGLEATVAYDPPGLDHVPDAKGRMNANAANGNATHGAVVSIDLETGHITPVFYAAVHDTGTLINPTIVDGQTIGGVVQGLGGALFEDVVYGDDGQPMAANLVDYLVPTTASIPVIVTEHLISPAEETPLGVKGVGEGGIIGPAGALANAVADALAEFDVEVRSTPLAPLVRRALADVPTAN
jgi:aerobic carbon-monoxide dehydrogenase large subunit